MPLRQGRAKLVNGALGAGRTVLVPPATAALRRARARGRNAPATEGRTVAVRIHGTGAKPIQTGLEGGAVSVIGAFHAELARRIAARVRALARVVIGGALHALVPLGVTNASRVSARAVLVAGALGTDAVLVAGHPIERTQRQPRPAAGNAARVLASEVERIAAVRILAAFNAHAARRVALLREETALLVERCVRIAPGTRRISAEPFATITTGPLRPTSGRHSPLAATAVTAERLAAAEAGATA